MKPELAKIIDGLKYMWDGEIYETKDAAENMKKDYEKNNFQTMLIKENDKYLLYTRKVVTEIIIDGNAPV